MIRKIFGIFLFGVTLSMGLTSCVDEDFEELGDTGQTYIKFLEATETSHFFSPFTNVRRIDLFSVRRDANNEEALNTSTTVRLVAAPELIEAYNEEHETEVEFLDEEIYTLAENPSVVPTADGYNFNFAPGEFAKELTVLLDGSKWDLSRQYAVAYKIVDAEGTPIASGRDELIIFVSIKNPYDGVYRYTTSSNTSLRPDTDTEVELRTTGPNTVKLAPGLLGYYSNEVWYTVDPETNKITVTMPSLGVQEPQDDRSYYDPETKTLHVYWKQGNGGRTFEETFEYKGER